MKTLLIRIHRLCDDAKSFVRGTGSTKRRREYLFETLAKRG